MTREEILAKLKANEGELKAAGIVRLSIFGSVARGDNSAVSDIDLLADFDRTRRITLLTVGRLETRLAELLGKNVDLASSDWLQDTVRDRALREAIVAF